MESENTFHLKKKPSAPIPQYVNPGKARKEASRRRAFRSLPRERFLCRLGPFRPPHEIHRRDGSQPTVPCGSFRTGGHVPFCVLQSHSSGVEYIFPTPSLHTRPFPGRLRTQRGGHRALSLRMCGKTQPAYYGGLRHLLRKGSGDAQQPGNRRHHSGPP